MDSSQLSTLRAYADYGCSQLYRLHRGLFYSFLSDARRHQLQLHPVQPDGARFRAAALCDIQSVLLFADEPVPSIHPARSTHRFMRNSLRGADACGTVSDQSAAGFAHGRLYLRRSGYGFHLRQALRRSARVYRAASQRHLPAQHPFDRRRADPASAMLPPF